MKKVLAIYLQIIVIPIYAQDALKPIIAEHILEKKQVFVTFFAEHISDFGYTLGSVDIPTELRNSAL